MRYKATFPLAPGQYDHVKSSMLNWTKQFSMLLFLDSNAYASKFEGYECLLAVDAIDEAHTVEEVQQLHDAQKDWLFGHICYDYKNELEVKLSSRHTGQLGFPLLSFFRPRIVCYVDRRKELLTIESIGTSPGDVFAAIQDTDNSSASLLPKLVFKHKIGKEEYLQTIAKLREHIADGDCYEINYCAERYCDKAEVEPFAVFRALNELSPAPFAAYYRHKNQYMMCASPERYLKKEGNILISQPIKGTASRARDREADEQAKTDLYTSIKERAENVMIVDLVRNDLARVSETGSVKVDELFGIYTYPQVHQMISTVSSTLKKGTSFTDAIRYSFPMGSMTGAPKIKVMQLIDQYEQSKRELFSGTVGYITPAGDFDFNVIIRSLFYNESARYLSYQTGGAITYDSNAEQEWEEMRLKAWALEKIFT